MSDRLLTAKEAAEHVGLTADAIYQLSRAGKIAHYRLGVKGGSIKFRAADLDAYMEGCRVEAGIRRGKRPDSPLKHVQAQP
jgi:excisionase family DNA binding protein